MKEILDQIESYLEKLVEGSSDRIFKTVDAEKKLIHQIMDAMGGTISSDVRGNLLAPNNYSLNVPVDDLEEIRSAQPLIDQLSEKITQATKNAGININGLVTISVFPDKDLAPGEFTFHAIWKDELLAETAPTNLVSEGIHALHSIPKAFLIVGGTQIFTLQDEIINIGRQLENNLVVNDPRVSRKHAQVRVIKGRHVLFDLGSSGGTKVNNKPIKQVTLHPGDVITLAGVPLVYGHDSVSSITDTKEYIPPDRNDVSGASTTTNKFPLLDSDPDVDL